MYCNVPRIDMAATGLNIYQLRTKNNYRVADIQNIFDFTSPQAIYKWESGQSLPTIERMITLSRIFNCSVEDIVVMEEDPWSTDHSTAMGHL